MKKIIIILMLTISTLQPLIAGGLRYTEVLLYKKRFYPLENIGGPTYEEKTLKHIINSRNSDTVFFKCLEQNIKNECLSVEPQLQLQNGQFFRFVNNVTRKPLVINRKDIAISEKVFKKTRRLLRYSL